ncbi:MAG: alpha/beta hydrolase domain-containing protein [Burkholderiales bacterium]
MLDTMIGRWPATGVALAGTVAALLSACGGSDDTAGPAATPQMTLTVTATEDFPGTYGSVGAYEKVTGTVAGEVNPKDRHNAIIQDLALAPVNARGMVEYKAEFVLIKPKDMSKSNGVLRYDAPNRGNILTLLNPTTTPSDAEYLERGYSMLYSAWQGDVPKSSPARLTLTVPVAKNADGSSITGTYRSELIISAATPVVTLPNGVFNGSMIPYAPVSLDNTLPGYTLTKRVKETDPRILVPASDWKFADCNATTNPYPGTADGTKVCVKGGFDPSYLYELVYVAKDPKVMGVGLAALRDMIGFFRNAAADAAGTANPLAGSVKYAIGQGTSQSGNAMKTFLHLGFNEALDGGKVFDGLYAHVAARQTNINTRFAVPGGGGAIRTDHTAFGQTAPRGLAADYRDDVAGRTGGVMARCTASNTCPKFFLGLSGTEFWQLQGSPVLTDAYGVSDIAQPDNARIYYYSSTQHGGNGGVANITYAPAVGTYPLGTVAQHVDTFRALFIDLEDWVVNGIAPPASQVPAIANGTLVRPSQVSFPIMKGVTWPIAGVQTAIPDFQYLARYNSFSLLDFGPQYLPQDESGIATQLPPYYTGKDYAILVPQVDPSTGNTTSGIRSVAVQAPLGTNIEFNPMSNPLFNENVSLTGSFIPFHKTEAARAAAGDTRPSLESLYGTQTGYVAAVTAAANDLVARRFLLRRDADRIISDAAATPVLP